MHGKQNSTLKKSSCLLLLVSYFNGKQISENVCVCIFKHFRMTISTQSYESNLIHNQCFVPTKQNPLVFFKQLNVFTLVVITYYADPKIRINLHPFPSPSYVTRRQPNSEVTPLKHIRHHDDV